MNRFLLLFWILFLIVGWTIPRFDQPKTVSFIYPENWPVPEYNFSSNPLTNEGFVLGRMLFYETALSRDSTISCASCHLQNTGFAHVDHNVSHGIDGRKGTRNAPALINLAWNKTFHWDGGVISLDAQYLNPLTHPAEMDISIKEVLFRLNQSEKYRKQFFTAFGKNQITTALLSKAISQFTVNLVSANSLYDKVQRNEKGYTFNNQQQNGLLIFRNYCSSCHKEPLFQTNRFESNGLWVDTIYNDAGRYSVTHLSTDSMKFRVPTLRNIEFTFPYMHDGRFRKLKDVINYYSDSIKTDLPYLSKELQKPIHLNEQQKKDLLAFLKTLTDQDFLTNQAFSYPKNEKF